MATRTTSRSTRQLGEHVAADHDRINLGCGTDYRDDCLNVDIDERHDPDFSWDLDDVPWPWPDDSFEFVLASNVLEHLQDQHAALHELARITAPGGLIEIAFPHPASRGQWVDPTHEEPLHPETFEHDLAPEWVVEDVSVSTVRFGQILPESWALWWADHLGFIVDEVSVTLRIPDDE